MKYILLIIFALTLNIYSQTLIGTATTFSNITTEPELNGMSGSRNLMVIYRGNIIEVDSILFNDTGELWCHACERGSIYSGYFKLSNLEFDYETQIKVDSISKVREDEYKAWSVKFNKELKVRAEKESEQQLIAKKERLVREQKELKERKAFLTKKYGKKNAQGILNGEIWLGMSKAMALESWGKPDDINRTVGSWGVHEQCIYGNQYLYFENGKLTSWQD